ncbi:MAG: hypothetical protein Ta2A_26780 [Treponemataceae bacterium]|nr:MAG: hypothetical protein Ta2A_26780 [Treponemataceae bacterium]
MLRVYLETTIFNIFIEEDREYCKETKELFTSIRLKKIDAFTSAYVIQELEEASEPKKSKMLDLITEYNIAVLEYDARAFELADLYIELEILPRKSRVDGAHIAMSAIHDMDCIVSLNFKHINKLKTKAATEVIHKIKGFSNPYICTPMEVINYE